MMVSPATRQQHPSLSTSLLHPSPPPLPCSASVSFGLLTYGWRAAKAEGRLTHFHISNNKAHVEFDVGFSCAIGMRLPQCTRSKPGASWHRTNRKDDGRRQSASWSLDATGLSGGASRRRYTRDCPPLLSPAMARPSLEKVERRKGGCYSRNERKLPPGKPVAFHAERSHARANVRRPTGSRSPLGADRWPSLAGFGNLILLCRGRGGILGRGLLGRLVRLLLRCRLGVRLVLHDALVDELLDGLDTLPADQLPPHPPLDVLRYITSCGIGPPPVSWLAKSRSRSGLTTANTTPPATGPAV